MAFTKTLTCSTTNLTITNAHCVVGKIVDYGDHCLIYVDIHPTAGDVAYTPCNSIEVMCEDSDYTTYFAESVLDDADKTLRTQAQAYVLTQDTFTGGTPV